MNRLSFYNKVWNDDEKVFEFDFLWSNMNKFEMLYEPGYYRVSSTDFMRPDLISHKLYGTTDYWWVICLVNGIDNPLEDIKLGTILKAPTKLDLYNFYRKYRIQA